MREKTGCRMWQNAHIWALKIQKLPGPDSSRKWFIVLAWIGSYFSLLIITVVLHLSVSHSVHRGCLADIPLGRHPMGGHPMGRYPPARHPTRADTLPLPDGHCSGRYASYWNAFLFLLCLHVLNSVNGSVALFLHCLPSGDRFRSSLRVYSVGGYDYMNAVMVEVNIRMLMFVVVF